MFADYDELTDEFLNQAAHHRMTHQTRNHLHAFLPVINEDWKKSNLPRQNRIVLY
jgi:hypothetical protein